MMKRILIVGGWNTTHIRRFLGVLCRSKNEGIIIEAFDPSMADTSFYEVPVDKVYRINKSRIQTMLYSIRKFGALLYELRQKREFKRVIRGQHYDLVNFHQVPHNIYDYVRICHRHNTKVMLTPFGSDVLRVSRFYVSGLRKAFDKCDYVSANKITGFSHKIRERYRVDEKKIVNLGYGSETITSIVKMKGNYSRHQLTDMIGVPYSDYYIVCGYTASVAQRHSLMIDAIYKNLELLPPNYCVLIPLTYGTAKEHLIKNLSEQCNKLGLRYHLLTEYLDNDQVAALRLVSNLFIHIQPTDAYNTSLQEFLLSGTECINGKWLDYPSLERFGKPYYICESLDSLSDILARVLQHNVQKEPLHPDVIDEIVSNSWENRIIGWCSFYNAI